MRARFLSGTGRRLATGAVALLVAAAVAAPDDDGAPKELRVQLSPFSVLAMSAEFDGWSKLRSGNFLVYTDATPTAAKAVLRELEAIASVCERILPPTALPQTSPVVIVLPGAASEWRQLESKTGYEWKVAASVVDAKPTGLVTVTYDWQRAGTGSLRSAAAKALLSRRGQDGPFWYTMGFGNIFREASFEAGHLLLNDRDKEWARVMRNGLWLQWGRFFEVNNFSPEFVSAHGVERYLSQASVTTHFLLFEAPAATAGLRRWREAQKAGAEPTKANFEAGVGEPLRVWARRVWDYATLPPPQQFAIEWDDAAFQIAAADATARELRELFVVVQMLARRDDAAKKALAELPPRPRPPDLVDLFNAAKRAAE